MPAEAADAVPEWFSGCNVCDVPIETRLTAHREAPTLHTERLRLRCHALVDLSHCVAMWSDPGVSRHTIGEPSAPQRTWLRLLGYLGHWQLLGFGYWALEEKLSGQYVGECGFAEFRRGLHPSIDGMPELGWVVAPRAQGVGYATEALRAIVDWGDAHFGGLTTSCIIQRANLRSLRVAEKLGYRALDSGSAARQSEVLLVREPDSGGHAIGGMETSRHQEKGRK